MTENPNYLNLDSLQPYYQGSVHNLYTLADGPPDLLVSETTSGGSVFDVGRLFSIEESDLSRACFRHAIYQQLADPLAWQDMGKHIAKDQRHSYIASDPLLSSVLNELMQQGMKTHHIGMIERESGKVFSRGFPPDVPSNLSLIRKYQVIQPSIQHWQSSHFFDYSSYSSVRNYVVPLEYIVRFGITSGSSVFTRYQQLSTHQQQHMLHELGVDSLSAWQQLEVPIVDCTSKYEPEDRFLSRQEAALVSSLSGDVFCRSLALATLASCFVEQHLRRFGLTVWDMKWELASSDDGLVIVDTIDTDSMRITMEVVRDQETFLVHFSKQAMRDYYQIQHPQWVAAIHEAKIQAASRGERFVNILQSGQKSGEFPQTPEPDPAFMAIQCQKLQLVRDQVSLKIEEKNNAFYSVASREVDYYLWSSGNSAYRHLNAVDTSV